MSCCFLKIFEKFITIFLCFTLGMKNVGSTETNQISPGLNADCKKLSSCQDFETEVSVINCLYFGCNVSLPMSHHLKKLNKMKKPLDTYHRPQFEKHGP